MAGTPWTNQVVSLTEFYEGWVTALGKERAVDYLIVCMRKGQEALDRALEARKLGTRKQKR